jgi:hypothetical protein
MKVVKKDQIGEKIEVFQKDLRDAYQECQVNLVRCKIKEYIFTNL